MAGSKMAGALPLYGAERQRMLQEWVDMRAQCPSTAEAARRMKVPINTAKYWANTARTEGIFPTPAKPQAGEYDIPNGIDLAPKRVHIGEPCKVLVMNDIHVPYHSKSALEAAFADGVKFGADMIVLNGDIMDCGSLSRFAKSNRERMGWETERETGKAFFKALRSAFPKARILYRPGNHERRLPMYLAANVQELADMVELRLSNLLGLSGYGVEWIEDQAPLSIGLLEVRHGDEWRIGAGVINPAKLANDRARASVIIGHFHRKSEYAHRGTDGSVTAGWSVPCLSELRPAYMPENNWSHGHATIESDGREFHVNLRSIIHGRCY